MRYTFDSPEHLRGCRDGIDKAFSCSTCRAVAKFASQYALKHSNTEYLGHLAPRRKFVYQGPFFGSTNASGCYHIFPEVIEALNSWTHRFQGFAFIEITKSSLFLFKLAMLSVVIIVLNPALLKRFPLSHSPVIVWRYIISLISRSWFKIANIALISSSLTIAEFIKRM